MIALRIRNGLVCLELLAVFVVLSVLSILLLPLFGHSEENGFPL